MIPLDVDQWLRYYNNERPHSGKICLGKTPMQTFEENKRVAVEKSDHRKDIADSRYLYDGNAA
jgi:hypothetical protein